MIFSAGWKEKYLAWENEKEVVEGLGTGLFVTIRYHGLCVNSTPHSYGCAKILVGRFFLIMQNLTPRVSEVRKLLVSLDIGQHSRAKECIGDSHCKKEYFLRDQQSS